MKELDFDELDRAVNTLMGDVAKNTPAPVVDDDVTTLTITPTLDAAKDTTATPVATPAPVVQSTSTVPAPHPGQQPPASRRSGRFMDVVHPSSDMRGSTLAAPARPVSRQGATLSPVSVPSESTPTPAVVAASPSGEQATEWPDPLDMAGYHREPDTTTGVSVDEHEVSGGGLAEPTQTTEEHDSEAISAQMQDISEESLDQEADDATSSATGIEQEPEDESLANEQPLTSPFLADAKVEKRPLGGSGGSTTPADTPVEEPDHTPVLGALATNDSPALADPEAQLPAMPEVQELVVTLPEELSGDLVSVESDTHEDQTSTAAQAPATAVAASSGGPTSIAQQYKEQPSTGDHTNGGIYDTAAYHKPLAHPAKKKSSWLWVIWIVILLILGAAGGAAAYLFLLK